MNYIEQKVEEFDLLQGGFDWWNHKPKREKAQDWLRTTLQDVENHTREEVLDAVLKVAQETTISTKMGFTPLIVNPQEFRNLVDGYAAHLTTK